MIFNNFIYVLKKFKTSSILNLLGLSAAIFIFLVIAIQVHYDLTFNASIDNHENIFQLVKKQTSAEGVLLHNYFSTDEGNIIMDDCPEIENHCYVQGGDYDKDVIIYSEEGKEEIEFNEYSTIVTEGFKDIFNPHILEGNIDDALSIMGNTMISQSTAKKLFGNKSPIGETVKISTFDIQTIQDKEGKEIGVNINSVYKPFTIKAIYEDYADNSSINNGFITYIPSEKHLLYNQLYLKVDKNQSDVLQKKLNVEDKVKLLDFKFLRTDGEHNSDVKIEIKNTLKLIPIKNIQINYPTVSQKPQDKNNVYFLISIALFSLIIAYINFINFTTAMAPARVKSLNIKLILGSDINKMRIVIACEALLYTLLAFFIALVALYSAQGTDITHLFTADITITKHIGLFASICSILLFISFLIGLYPAYYITNFNPITVLNSTSVTGIQSSKTRNILIIIQLFVAICFITIALFVKQQHSLLVNSKLGFEKENILLLNTDSRNGTLLDTDIKTFLEEVGRNPAIKEYAASNLVIGNAGGSSQSSSDKDGKTFMFNRIEVSDNFLDFFHIPIAEGEGLKGEKLGHLQKTVVNEQFIRRHNIKNGLQELKDEDVIKSMKIFDMVGIVKDFNYEPLLKEIGSLAIVSTDINRLPNIYIRPADDKTLEARKYIEATWKKFSNKEINLRFLDSYLESSYQSEETLSKAISIVSLIIILIAIMGVYGLITFQTKYRTKEIAIRKVNGATVKDISYILNKNLLILFVIAFILAIPVVYYIISLWLEHFPHRIGIGTGIFVLGGLLVLIITTITVSVQSYKAATANPVKSLKSE